MAKAMVETATGEKCPECGRERATKLASEHKCRFCGHRWPYGRQDCKCPEGWK